MKKKEILSLEILYDYKEELDTLLEDEDFHKLILDEAVKVIDEAIKQNEPSVRLAYISNLESSIFIQKSNFKKVINKALSFYEKKEDYDKCSELVKLKNKI